LVSGDDEETAAMGRILRIPFLIRWKRRIPAGRRCDTLLGVADIAPTVLSLMGLNVPLNMEGTDLFAAILGRDVPELSSVFLMDIVTTDEGLRQGLHEWRGIRTKRYTYARWVEGDGWVLYDNEADPYQLNNLIDSSDAASLRDKLEAQLQRWLKRTGDECLSWEENICRLGLVKLRNARERKLQPKPRLLRG